MHGRQPPQARRRLRAVQTMHVRPRDTTAFAMLSPSGPLSSPFQERVIIEDLLALEEGRLTDFRVFLKDHVDWDGGTDL